MIHAEFESPWDELIHYLKVGDSEGLQQFFGKLPPEEEAWLMSRLAPKAQAHVMAMLDPEAAADMLEEISESQALDIIEELTTQQAAPIFEQMQSDLQADLLARLPQGEAQEILGILPPEDADDARRLMAYEPDEAGGMMVTEYLAYREDQKVQEVFDDLRTHGEVYSDYEIQYAYILTPENRLSGVLALRDLLFANRSLAIREVMIADPLRVHHKQNLDQIVQFFQDHQLVGAPVVDGDGRLVGVVQRNAVLKRKANRASRTFMLVSGIIGGEEYRTMPLFSRSFRRLAWLSINIVLNILAASVIAAYTGTLEQVIALAIFLPMISDMSGCSGNQAVAVSMRELSLGLIKPHELVRVFFKEASLGVINGLALGLLLALVAGVWTGNPYLGLVVGSALALNTVVSVILGGTLPLFLRKIRVDPALVSGPALTTVTDMCGFLFALGLATLLLAKLV